MTSRILLGLAALLLIATAVFHATGLPMAAGWFSDERAGIMRMLWLTPTIDWSLVALFWAYVAAGARADLRLLAVAAAIVPGASAALLFSVVGLAHPGPAMLAGATALAVIGASRLRAMPPAA
jgi:hypothetical protein